MISNSKYFKNMWTMPSKLAQNVATVIEYYTSNFMSIKGDAAESITEGKIPKSQINTLSGQIIM